MEPITPPIDLFALENLPFDAQKEIALKLSYENIISFCKASKKLKRICDDVYFWGKYLKTNIPVHVNIPLRVSVNWYKNRIMTYPDVKKLTDLIKEKKIAVEYVGSFNKNWDIFETMENLKQLYCGNNQLTSLPFLPNLEILYCQDNQLTSLGPSKFPILPKLQLLSCSRNRLTSIPYLPNLESLYCDNNQLISIPSLPNLQKLHCEGNKIRFLPSFPDLQILYCRFNALTSLPPMPNLAELICEDNPLPGFTLEYWKEIWNKNK